MRRRERESDGSTHRMTDHAGTTDAECSDQVGKRFAERVDAIGVARGARLFAVPEAGKVGSDHAKPFGEEIDHVVENQMAHDESVHQEQRRSGRVTGERGADSHAPHGDVLGLPFPGGHGRQATRGPPEPQIAEKGNWATM